MVAQSDEPQRGTVLSGKYELHSVLGKGGMGVVFRGTHLGTDRPIAVKVLRRELLADPTLAKRFMREAKAAAALQHPNVVDVLDYGVDPDGTAFQVLELLEGESLGEHLQRKGTIPVDVTLSLVLPVIHALATAHARGVIHRDLKPDNIFLARNAHGRIVPKLLDFGIAKLLPKEGSASSTLATRAGTAIGTPAYMSPEQARGTADVGTTTDIWAIGVILFECVAGRIPFEAETGSILMARIIMEQAPSLASVAPEIPAPIVAVIDRALASHSARRWPTMTELANALRDAALESDIAVPPVGASDTAPMSRPPPRREAEPDDDRPNSSGDGDSDFDFQPAARLASPGEAHSVTGAVTAPRRAAPAGRDIELKETSTPVVTTAAPASQDVPRAATARIPIAPVVAVSLVLAALVLLGLYRRASDAGAPIETAVAEPPRAAVAPRVDAVELGLLPVEVDALPVDAVPVAVETAEVDPVAPEAQDVREVPARASSRERRARGPAAHVEPSTGPAAAPRVRGSQLPELTEW